MKILASLFSLLLLLSACETIEGAGRDIENAGDAIEDAADG
ncbi:MAG: entericidin A/B family lipoprotein [Pseudomonadota bacterium]